MGALIILTSPYSLPKKKRSGQHGSYCSRWNELKKVEISPHIYQVQGMEGSLSPGGNQVIQRFLNSTGLREGVDRALNDHQPGELEQSYQMGPPIYFPAMKGEVNNWLMTERGKRRGFKVEGRPVPVALYLRK